MTEGSGTREDGMKGGFMISDEEFYANVDWRMSNFTALLSLPVYLLAEEAATGWPRLVRAAAEILDKKEPKDGPGERGVKGKPERWHSKEEQYSAVLRSARGLPYDRLEQIRGGDHVELDNAVWCVLDPRLDVKRGFRSEA